MKYLIILLFGLSFLSCNGQTNTQTATNQSEAQEEEFAIQKTEAQWRQELTDMEFFILRKAGTENPGSSELLNIKAEGIYVCAACETPLFKSDHKFDSGTGWPSFDRAIEGNVAYSVDYKIGYKRTEEHCAKCGGHLGHVFEDGPRETTGQRHCINGAALNFVPVQ
jgi:peptide-methionine (R)-S-oxide reductase